MPPARCPICDSKMPGNWTEYPQYPFCTKRCKLVDLGRWLKEDYRVAKPIEQDRSTPGEGGEADA